MIKLIILSFIKIAFSQSTVCLDQTSDFQKKYCSCVKSKINPKMNWIEESFRDKKEDFIQKDLCIQEHVNNALHIQVYYLIASSEFYHFIISKIEDRINTAHIKMVSNETSYGRFEGCLVQNYRESCFKTKSLAITYQCILNKTNDIDEFYQRCMDELSKDQEFDDLKALSI